MKIIRLIIVAVIFLLAGGNAFSAETLQSLIQPLVVATVPQNMGIGKVRVLSVDDSEKQKIVTINLNESYADVPFTHESIEQLKNDIRSKLGNTYNDYAIKILINKNDIEKYFGTFPSNLPIKNGRFITRLDVPDKYSLGLDGNVIAMWQSHGWYFESKLNRWEWQRARIFDTVEDLYTQSYVMPFLMPMLENAGAYVFSPRERDVQSFEAIVDNDQKFAKGSYKEINGTQIWNSGKEQGFAYNTIQLTEHQNPFREGTYRQVNTVTKNSKVSKASWNATFPHDGLYAVYVSYKSLPNSAEDVEYTVNHAGGSEHFQINQKMGGGTWIYLGHFQFAAGTQSLPVVEVSNHSANASAVVTADAVKIGGGMGNVARRVVPVVTDEGKKNKKKSAPKEELPDYQYQISNYPRFTEGARYFLQWAGVPDSVYSPTNYANDYTDDYRCRGNWVNYLAGGSSVLPNNKGLNVPVDLSFAFHTDAGTYRGDTIVGTLGIYCTNSFADYANGMPRIMSRQFTNTVMSNIVNDVRADFEPSWKRRGMWDKSYYEARVPEVPAMLLELLSHQNFSDMKYGLDPNFRFTVSRAIYKGMVQFIAERDKREYEIQPLAVNTFAIHKESVGKYRLTWSPTADSNCDKADAKKYYIYERIGKGGFKRIAVTSDTEYQVNISDHNIHSYKVTAVNDGGESFPSEILALAEARNSKGDVLVVNGFTRVSGPDSFDSFMKDSNGCDSLEIAGFTDAYDHGVPYIKDISFIGDQFEFRRNIPWMDDDAAGFGASRANYETKVIAGNTFDYPALHGEAIIAAGYSFVSASRAAIENGAVRMADFKFVDLIMGKQKECVCGAEHKQKKFKAYTPELKKAIKELTEAGGSIFISGAYVATELHNVEDPDKNDINFGADVLGFKWRVDQASVTGEAYQVPTKFKALTGGKYNYSNTLNEDMYCVESPDSMYPSDDKGAVFMRYGENNLVAGIVSNRGSYRTCVLGFPFETIKESKSRDALMMQVMNFLNKN